MLHKTRGTNTTCRAHKRAAAGRHHTPTSPAAAGLASLALSLGLTLSPSSADELSIAFPASAKPEIRAAQKVLVESWAYVDTLFVDPPSHTEWAAALQDALAASFKAGDAAEVTSITRGLLEKLDDPYTRLLQEEEDAALTAEEEGKIVATGLGLQQLSLPPSAAAAAADDASSTQQPPEQQQQQVLVVSFVVDGSAAAHAGIREGDAVLTIAGRPMAGKELRDIYRLLSNEADITLARQPPLPGGATSFSASAGDRGTADGVLQGVEEYTVHLKPTPLDFEPVQYGIIDLDKLQQGQVLSSSSSSSSSSTTIATDTTSLLHSSPSSQAPLLATTNGSDGAAQPAAGAPSRRAGYLKLLTFSATAPQAVAEALRDMVQPEEGSTGSTGSSGLAGLIVDLRDNPGGIVEAGVDIAQDFLHAGQVLCIAVDKSGEEERVILPEAHTLSELPLVVLVNHSTASTSELLAGALHDELHAPLIGTTTFGKGRTQRVIRLSDGKSTLLVSTLKYFTPQHSTIHSVGLQPDVVCKPDEVLGQQWLGGRVGDDDASLSLLDDPCIRLAAERFAVKGAV